MIFLCSFQSESLQNCLRNVGYTSGFTNSNYESKLNEQLNIAARSSVYRCVVLLPMLLKNGYFSVLFRYVPTTGDTLLLFRRTRIVLVFFKHSVWATGSGSVTLQQSPASETLFKGREMLKCPK